MPPALVMTSCNRADEPIAVTHEQVLAGMGDMVDGVLTHNREIRNRCDDSVVAAAPGRRVMLMRRSRGYVPEPILLEEDGPSVLATGGMNKVMFALTSGRRVFLSQHIGDVSDADSAAFFAQSFGDFSRLLRLEPEAVVCDLHPDYPTTEFARAIAAERGLPLLQVQHHYAHVAGCLAEHALDGPVIGVSWDGTGFGEDGAVWGGEFLVADRLDYRRAYHLRYVPMPGGEAAIRRPLRMALAHLAQALGPEEAARRLAGRMGAAECDAALQVMDRPRFSPQTSSAGRLFDAVSAFLGICEAETYEGQPAIEMEARCAAGPAQPYGFGYDGLDIVVSETWRGICEDADAGVPVDRIAARFHATMARVIIETCRRIREEDGLETVALSGGVMQNRTLLAQAMAGLEADGFRVLTQQLVPPNDAGMSFGQAAWAVAKLRSGGGTPPDSRRDGGATERRPLAGWVWASRPHPLMLGPGGEMSDVLGDTGEAAGGGRRDRQGRAGGDGARGRAAAHRGRARRRLRARSRRFCHPEGRRGGGRGDAEALRAALRPGAGGR